MASTVLWKERREKKRENRSCRQSDDKIKVAAQKRGKKSDRNLVACVRFLAEIRSFRVSGGLTCGESRRRRVRLRCLAGALVTRGAAQR